MDCPIDPACKYRNSYKSCTDGSRELDQWEHVRKVHPDKVTEYRQTV